MINTSIQDHQHNTTQIIPVSYSIFLLHSFGILFTDGKILTRKSLILNQNFVLLPVYIRRNKRLQINQLSYRKEFYWILFHPMSSFSIQTFIPKNISKSTDLSMLPFQLKLISKWKHVIFEIWCRKLESLTW